MSAGLASVTALILLASVGVAAAQSGIAGPIECSRFLHNRDGSWSSFWQGDVFGSYGPMVIHPGERFSRGAERGRADIARILDRLCGD